MFFGWDICSVLVGSLNRTNALVLTLKVLTDEVIGLLLFVHHAALTLILNTKSSTWILCDCFAVLGS
jgi:hypothetical protein